MANNIKSNISDAVNKLLKTFNTNNDLITDDQITITITIIDMDQQGRGKNGWDCGPITFSNIEDYARASLSSTQLAQGPPKAPYTSLFKVGEVFSSPPSCLLLLKNLHVCEELACVGEQEGARVEAALIAISALFNHFL